MIVERERSAKIGRRRSGSDTDKKRAANRRLISPGEGLTSRGRWNSPWRSVNVAENRHDGGKEKRRGEDLKEEALTSGRYT